MSRNTVLVVDDDTGHRLTLETLLTRWGLTVTGAENGESAVCAVEQQPYDAVLMDIRMRGMDGLTALKAIKEYNPAVPVVIMTAFSAVESAVDALKSGACDYLVKPLDFDVLRLTLERAMEHSALKVENCTLRQQLSRNTSVAQSIVGTSPPIRTLLDMIATVAPAEANVLITGKSGTGKELVARALHQGSGRCDGPLVTVNCAALSEGLLESELFGHERGAFTGADKRRNGRFMQAHGGTLFLDEIGEMPLSMQARLLRAIQQREIQRVGSDEPLTVDVRLVAATNRDLREEVAGGRFREDLFYRLFVVVIRIPPLRERPEDIPLLIQHFLQQSAKENNRTIEAITPDALHVLSAYPWPGNVRELRNAIERMVVLTRSPRITLRDVPAEIRDNKTAVTASVAMPTPGAPPLSIDEAEKNLIAKALKATNGNRTLAAKQLGISRRTLHRKLNEYGLHDA